MLNYQDLNLPSQVTSILEDFNDEVVSREEALKLLSRILKYREDKGYDNSTLVEVLKRVWNS